MSSDVTDVSMPSCGEVAVTAKGGVAARLRRATRPAGEEQASNGERLRR
ncbi:hypothetical protein MINT15_22980 [Saccharomonospora viridis]|uniref:Uncharacterized protein n=1 Tax=Saccharomonospora viridis TaxID=1852 RepID=A0A837D863_9PSEU|nr:hypothetical protein MINT15_22980 [Saccharomonospora viridis]